jgi:hypothetical protein
MSHSRQPGYSRGHRKGSQAFVKVTSHSAKLKYTCDITGSQASRYGTEQAAKIFEKSQGKQPGFWIPVGHITGGKAYG